MWRIFKNCNMKKKKLEKNPRNLKVFAQNLALRANSQNFTWYNIQ